MAISSPSATSSTSGVGVAIYGDGSDDSVVFDGVATILGMAPSSNIYTMTRDIFCINITVNSGVTLKPSQFKIHATGTLTNAGIVSNDGNNATSSAGGATLSAAGTLQFGGIQGNTGRTTTGAGGNGTGSNPGIGGNGGNGGTGGGANVGGTGGATVAPGATLSAFRALNFVMFPRFLSGTSTIAAVFGGSSGASGGATFNSDTGRSGSGGGGASIVMLLCKNIDNTGGTIRANGGNAFNAQTTGDGTAVLGGGGGGGGGVVYYVTDNLIAAGTIQVNGGTAGTGYNGGASGVDGAVGKIIALRP